MEDEAYYVGLNEQEKYYADLADKLTALAVSGSDEHNALFLSLSLADVKALAAEYGRRAEYNGRKARAMEQFDRLK
jgi:hypothetical protein